MLIFEIDRSQKMRISSFKEGQSSNTTLVKGGGQGGSCVRFSNVDLCKPLVGPLLYFN